MGHMRLCEAHVCRAYIVGKDSVSDFGRANEVAMEGERTHA